MRIPFKLSNGLAVAILSCSLVPLAARAADDDGAKLRAAVDQAIRPIMAEYDVPGLAVAVTIDGRTRFFNYGVASKEKNTPVSEHTLFELGSVSKTLVATLATYAQVLGKLSLDDHPGKYMPELKGSPIDQASLLDLGAYTAGGLPLQFPDEISDAKMVGYFQQWKPDAAPGVQRRYSNPSIGLLGYITGVALNSDFADAMQGGLFPKLGLKESYLRVPDGAMASYAWGYNKENRPIRMNPGVLATQAYGVRSSSADMIRFVQANIAPERLDASVRRAIEATHVGYFKVGTMVQGLGWEQYRYPVSLANLLAGNSSRISGEANPAQRLAATPATPGAILFNKTGATGGFSSYVAFVPEKKIGVVLLANKFFPGPARIKAVYAILEQL